MNKKTGLGKDERRSRAQLIEELRAAKRKTAVLERALRKSEKKFLNLVESIIDVLYAIDSGGVITYVSPAIKNVLGYERDEFVGRHFMEFIYEEDKSILTQRMSELRNGIIEPAEYRMIGKQGNIKWVRTLTNPIHEAGVFAGGQGLLIDITERKRAEEAIQSLARFPSENPNPILRIARDGTLLYTNQAGLSLLPEWHLQVGQAAPPMLREAVFQAMDSGLSQMLHLEVRQLVYSFFLVPVVDTGYANLYGRDITDRKRAEEALHESEEKLRVLFEQLPIGITLMDQNRNVIYANPATGKIVDLSMDDLLQGEHQNRRYIRPDGTPMPLEEFASMRAFQEQQTVRDVEIGLITEGGKTIWTSVSAAPFPGANQGVVVATVDITERKQAEEALRKSESNLRALALELSNAEDRERQRLALFLHDEIGQSLALLRMKLGNLAGAWKSKSGKQDIQQALELLEKLIDQTHSLTFELSPPILHQLGLEAAIEWAGEKISHDHGIEFTFSDDGMMKPLDTDIKTLLFHCVEELMMNIVKHAKARRMTVSLKRTQNQFCAVVEDNGIGFDSSLLERQPDMLGFGLFSIRERLAAVSGTIELRSEPGRGTCATLSVPLKEEKPSS